MGLPRQFAHSLKGTAAEEEDALVVGRQQKSILIERTTETSKILFVINKINLKASRGQRTDFNDQLMVAVVHNQIHTRKANHLMELMLALVDVIEPRHKDTDLASQFLGKLRQMSCQQRGIILF